MSYEKVREAYQQAIVENAGQLVCGQPDADSNDWFAAPGSKRELTARKRCLDCPIYWQCQEYAVAAGVPDGTWGGVDENTRKRIWSSLPGGKPTHFIDEMDAALLPILQERRDHENFDANHDDPYATEEAA